MVKKYEKDDITVVWNPDKCIHSTICFHGLPEVFNPSKRPWINMEGNAADAIVKQVRKCPSGALTLADKQSDLGE